MWRDEEIKVDIPEGAEVVYTTPPQSPSIEGEGDPESSGEQGEFLSNYQGYDAEGKWCINPAIMKKIIQDEKGNYYRIVQMEYDFLMKH
ncbi:MAG: hypothetical protein H6767_03625 [Candidatus Peribacteria bacterium]|nr:MAG: hypothetical protein H6767_03625 [Candidatus Peribacteria bacterium]